MMNYFSFKELTCTNSAIDNSIPTEEFQSVVTNLMRLQIVLNVIRGFIRMPIRVNSAYRNYDVNFAVGGVPNSFHTKGRAVDITCENLDELKRICKSLAEQRILEEYIPYDNFIHIAI